MKGHIISSSILCFWCCRYLHAFSICKFTCSIRKLCRPVGLLVLYGATPDVFLQPTDGTAANSDDVKKVRRIRYSGSYPKEFKERYKEMRGDADTISKVLAKGSTPAGTHVPIMLEEVLEHLGLNQTDNAIKKTKNCLSVDCTLGFGGHSTEIVKRLVGYKNWMHFGIDQDVIEIAKTKERIINTFTAANTEADVDLIRRRISFHNQNFGDLEELASAQGFVGKVDILMADLGYSSMQIDDPLRGFTFKSEGPLDMRMDPTKGETALELLHRLKRNELIKILEENSDEVLALQIATCLKEEPIPATTTELSKRVRESVTAAELKKGDSVPTKDTLDSAVARTMQAIRIEVNGEFRVLEKLLEALPRVMAPGGRVAFLTFHSGEDRRVKKALKAGFNSGIYSEWSREVVRASFEERRNNPRSKCAKLRWATLSEKSTAK